jgi:hypothetical protein
VEARVTRIHAQYDDFGPALAVQVRIVRETDGKQTMLDFDHAEWSELRARIDKAFVFPEE